MMQWGVHNTVIYPRLQIDTIPGLQDALRGLFHSQLALQFVLGASITLNSSSRTRFTYVDGIHVSISNYPVLSLHVLAVNGQCKVLGHDSILVDDLHASLLERRAEILQGGVVVELGSVDETTGPREDGSHRVCRSFFALLPLTVVPGDSTMGSLALDGLAIRSDELTGHHSETSEALGQNVGLDVAIVVLASPDETSRRFDRLSDHVINQAVLVVDSCSFELGFVLAVEVRNQQS